MRADAELPWYFGSGPDTWASAAGIRSSLGYQLELVKESRKHRAPLEPSVVNVSAIEEAMHRRTGAVLVARRIERRLAYLTRVQVEALRLHYSETLPYVDGCAVLLAASRRLVVAQLYARARGHLASVRKAAKAGNLGRVHAELGAFMRLRYAARSTRSSRYPLAAEVLRRALHEADRASRRRIAELADKLWRSAAEAYNAVRLEDDDRRVQVEDPRPGRR